MSAMSETEELRVSVRDGAVEVLGFAEYLLRMHFPEEELPGVINLWSDVLRMQELLKGLDAARVAVGGVGRDAEAVMDLGNRIVRRGSRGDSPRRDLLASVGIVVNVTAAILSIVEPEPGDRVELVDCMSRLTKIEARLIEME